MIAADTALDELRHAIGAICDPEIPVLTIADLGILRSVEWVDGGAVVTITPTYSGCPAMQYIEDEINRALAAANVTGAVETVFSPAWSTDWMSDEGRSKLEAYGIAPPHGAASPEGAPVTIRTAVRCPHCGSTDTEVVSQFGSTACKALYRCRGCLEPFDYFKEL